MPESRPAIPAALHRAVRMEAGHRCAIPTCKNTPIEIAHIDPWSKVKEHAFENLIALCPTCHAQYDRGDIDRQSILGYKSNLATLNGRYGSFERRALQFFADGGEPGSAWPTDEERAQGVEPGSMWLTPHILRTIGDRDIDLYFLLRDGMLEKKELPSMMIGDLPVLHIYELTQAGNDLVARWKDAEAL